MTAVMTGVEHEAAPASATPSAPSRSNSPEKPKGLGHYLLVSLSAAALLLMLALAAAVIVVPAMTKSVPMTVLTSSMEPKLPPGTLLIVKPVDVNDIRVGDVITYQIRSGEPDVITHRVIAVTTSTTGERLFTLQGDNNGSPDPDPIRAVQVQGRLWYSVPYIGWVNTWVNGENRAWIIPLVAGGLFAYAVWMVISGIIGNRKKKRNANRRIGRHAA
jgi:signal peptidase